MNEKIVNFWTRFIPAIRSGFFVFGFIIGFLGFSGVCEVVYGGGAAEAIPPDVLLNATSMIHIVYRDNPDVQIARFSLEAAEYQFKDFERDLSQFTPLLARSSIEREERSPDENQFYHMQVGMEKEFFNGSSVFAGVGHQGEFGDNSDGTSNALELDVQFPVFGSNTTLRRITQRSREENELYNARLEYIDEVRYAIQQAQENYFWLLTCWERYDLYNRCVADYEDLLKTPQVISHSSGHRQVEGEIQALQSEILNQKRYIDSFLFDLQLSVGVEKLELAQLSRMNLFSPNYYGKSYIAAKREALVKKAEENDIRIRVLENAKRNSEEKKRLAEKGKWDIFVDLFGQYDLEGRRDLKDDDGYSVSIGFRLKRIDSTLLGYSLRRAEAEIKKYEAEIRAQQLQTLNRIDKEWLQAKSRRQQCDELAASVLSRREVFEQKRKNFLNDAESIDNLIQARKNLLETELDRINILGEYHETITELDYACGVYFAQLGINLSSVESKE